MLGSDGVSRDYMLLRRPLLGRLLHIELERVLREESAGRVHVQFKSQFLCDFLLIEARQVFDASFA